MEFSRVLFRSLDQGITAWPAPDAVMPCSSAVRRSQAYWSWLPVAVPTSRYGAAPGEVAASRMLVGPPIFHLAAISTGGGRFTRSFTPATLRREATACAVGLVPRLVFCVEPARESTQSRPSQEI